MTRLVCVADQHGFLPTIPKCDILLIGGDIVPVNNHQLWYQEQWLATNFINWTKSLPVKHILLVAGNHCFIFQQRPGIASKLFKNTNIVYLQDEGVTCEGLKVYGSPWQKPFFNWAFNLPEEEMAKKWELIPEDTNILLLHGPPYGYGDLVSRGEHVGSPSLLKRIEKVKPKLVVFGHVHCGRGRWKKDGIEFINASLVNEKYQMVYEPYVIELC